MRHILVLLALTWSCHAPRLDVGPKPPNVVLIMADDMGWSDLGCYGGEIATPHIDSRARDAHIGALEVH